MNIALAMTAVQHGAIVANHTEVVRLHKKADVSKGGKERIIGARLKDKMTGEEWDVRCRVGLPCLRGERELTSDRESSMPQDHSVMD